MTVIATNTVRPHLGKAKLQLNNMLEVTKAFGDMGITARVSRVVFGQNAGCLVFSTFAENFTEAMADVQNPSTETKSEHIRRDVNVTVEEIKIGAGFNISD